MCGEGEGAHDALFGEFDFEGVVLVGFRSGEGEVGGFSEGVGADDCADEEFFGFGSARPADWIVLLLISRPAATETRAKA